MVEHRFESEFVPDAPDLGAPLSTSGQHRTWMAWCSCDGWSDGPEHVLTLRARWRHHVRRARADELAERDGDLYAQVLAGLDATG